MWRKRTRQKLPVAAIDPNHDPPFARPQSGAGIRVARQIRHDAEIARQYRPAALVEHQIHREAESGDENDGIFAARGLRASPALCPRPGARANLSRLALAAAAT
jgi:hypothetical protein